MAAAQAFALISHRTHVIPDDIQALALACLSHRLVLHPEARLSGVDESSIVAAILRQVQVPVQ
jgi:MoxR-like ATPase